MSKSVACALGKLDRAHSSLRFSLRCDCLGLPHLPDRAEAGPRPGNRRPARLHCLVSADTPPPALAPPEPPPAQWQKDARD